MDTNNLDCSLKNNGYFCNSKNDVCVKCLKFIDYLIMTKGNDCGRLSFNCSKCTLGNICGDNKKRYLAAKKVKIKSILSCIYER